MGPDFSHVDSLATAKQLAADGALEPLLLLPAQFGGSPVPENVVYVPAWFARQKDEFDSNIVGPLIADGKVSRYRAVPEYQGSSFVPISIKIDAWDPGKISADLILWGDALLRSETPQT
jgi:hypothetical protein